MYCSEVHCCRLTSGRIFEKPDSRIDPPQFQNDLACFIEAATVDDEDFIIPVPRYNAADGLSNMSGLIEGRHDNADEASCQGFGLYQSLSRPALISGAT